MRRVRTLEFLPSIFQTPTNSQFLSATLDQLVNPPVTQTIDGYIGSKLGYGINAKDYYIPEPSKERKDYQLEPGVVFTKTNESVAKDFISYPGILDSLKLQNGITDDNNRLFNSQFYSWDSFTNLDMVVNFNEYYWLPQGLPAVTVTTNSGFININDILGEKNYTSPNGVVFTNGLKVIFDQTVIPTEYYDREYYVQGVGTAIELIDVLTLVVPESYTDNISNPYDIQNYSIGNYDSILYVPANPDYITIARNALNKNAWARSNRWFHIDVIKATAEYLNDPSIINRYGNPINKAVRPIIEFYPNLKLFNSGTIAKNAIDFIDTRTKDAFTLVAGQSEYYPDVQTYTTYTGKIYSNPSVYTGEYILGQQYKIEKLGTSNLNTWQGVGPVLTFDGNFVPGVEYIITQLGSTNWNQVAGTVGKFYQVGDKFVAANQGQTIGVGSGTALNVLFTAKNTGIFNSADLEAGQEYFITVLGTTPWQNLIQNVPTTIVNSENLEVPVGITSLVVGKSYVITDLGTTTQLEWNQIAGTNNNVYKVGTSFVCAQVGTGVSTGQAGTAYFIQSLGTLNQRRLNNIVGTSGITYNVGDLIIPKFATSPGAGVFIKKQITTNTLVSGLPFKVIGTGFAIQGTGLSQAQTTTTVEINASEVTGTFQVGMYINDLILNEQSKLPVNSRIYSYNKTNDLITLEVFWSLPTNVTGTTTDVASFVASTKNNVDLKLFSGARVVFAAEENQSIKEKIYIVNFNNIGLGYPSISLTEAFDGQMLESDQFVVVRGQINQGKSFYYDGVDYISAQQKQTINLQPKFDIFDQKGISFGNLNFYESSTFEGCELFRYKLGTGANDPVLGFPISYSSINNISDITFEISLNSDTFDYVSGIGQNEPITQKVVTGFVHNYFTRTEYNLLTGWQTAIAPSVQYQAFEFEYTPNNPPLNLESGETITYQITCDVPTLSLSETIWPNLQVLNNNNLLVLGTDYTVTYNTNDTVIDVILTSDVRTIIQVLLLSNKVSKNAYYTIPINLSNNPFNTDITSVDIGDIRGHYQSIYYNNQNSTGVVFGANNTRDLGNIVPYGTKIIQNSASLVLPGTFLRNPNYNLFNSLEFNSREYVKFKTLLVDTVNKTSFNQQFDPSFILDNVLEQIASVKNQDMPFFWSDMLPNKAAFITNVYTMFNDVLTSIYPLSRVYDFSSANYFGLLIYVQTKTVNGVTVVKQLYKGKDYTVSDTSPSVTVTYDLIKGDKVIVKEYNQTYGSYVPNTPTKLGLYPATVPSVIVDTAYNEPTYFIVGHDGSYNKLYGNYDPILGMLVDFRDQVLLEFEMRIYNNLKLKDAVPIQYANIIPGYFRTTEFSYDEWLLMYSPQFLNWIGQNRLDYKKQIYIANNPWTFNYRLARDKVNNSLIKQGYWRGIYQYYYDTTTPDQTPWEMIGYSNKPDWWESLYGPAPYTSDNLILWENLRDGYDYNNGNPVIREQYARPNLLSMLPVNDEGELLQPFYSVIGNFNNNTLQKDWIVGDDSPVELSYRRSSTYPFDVMRLYALMDTANFFNLGVDLDNYRYNSDLNQYLYNGRSHLVPSEIEIYGDGIAKTSYINWIVDYEKQFGIGATDKIKTLLDNLDVRLVYRAAGFSDKTLLKFFVEKSSPESRNASLLIPDESYQVLLYENQPYSRIVYSSVIIQLDNKGYRVYGNSQTSAYFTIAKPILNGNTSTIRIQDLSVKVANDYYNTTEYVPYGTYFYTIQEVAQFLTSYQRYLENQGMIFKECEQGIEVNWQLMIAEFLYWAQIGWTNGSILTVNPSANTLQITKENTIVQPLTLQQTNFILNQNLYPINNKDLAIYRNGPEFKASTLNAGDTISYAQFNLSNIEHGIVFNNTTLFDDVIYNLISGLRQNRIYVRGTKSAEWNGTMFASGFIYNQDNVNEWSGDLLYTKGSIVKYKNKFWTAIQIIQPNRIFNELDWKETEYDEIQKGLLPNPSTRSFESALYYNIDKANLELDADLLSFSLIGFRPRPYMTSADLTDITQVNVYKNMIKEKGTRNTLNAFRKADLPQGEIDYEIHENWAILSGEFGGVLNSNFIEFKLNENKLTFNPAIIGLTTGNDVEGSQQLVPLYSLFNYAKPITNTNVLPTISEYVPSKLFPEAGYVNYDDVKMMAYFYSNLPSAVDKNGQIVSIDEFYVNQYVWLADYLAQWQILTPFSKGQVIQVRNNLNDSSTVIFKEPHNLNQYEIFSIINFDTSVNGYYVVNQVINPYQILINLTLSNSNREITGQGIALGFNSQRVNKPSDIKNLPLLNYEFSKNKVWVDENTDGSWAVYRKDINYKLDLEITRSNSETFGNSLAYTLRGDYLIGDADAGTVIRYQFDVISGVYQEDQILNRGLSYGTSIVAAGNLAFISKPKTLTPSFNVGIQALFVNDTPISDDYEIYQLTGGQPYILPVSGSTNFGQTLALSDDTNYLFVSDFDDIFIQNVNAGTFVVGDAYEITSVGTTNFIAIGAESSTVGVIFTATGNGSGTGTANRLPRNRIHVYRKNNIDLSAASIVTGQTYQIKELGDTDYTLLGAIENKVGILFVAISTGTGTGKVIQCNYELVYTIQGPNNGPDNFGYSLSTNYYGDMLVVGAPYEDYSTTILNWGRSYVYQRLIQNFEVQTNDTNQDFVLSWTPDNSKPLSVYRNGKYLQATNYILTGNILKITIFLQSGDIINVGGNEFVKVQTLETEQNPRIGVQFGLSVDNNRYGSEICVGAPFALSQNNQEGAAYRYTYGSARFGYIIGNNPVNVTTDRVILLNGYAVTIPAGNATLAVKTINDAKITNIQASASNNILTIYVVNQDLTQVNQKLLIGVIDEITLTELGFDLFTQTQIILCPHIQGPTQFGTAIKFNEFNSLVISAPVGTRYGLTTFDFTDDDNLDNDTLFDNNSTQFLDNFPNAGAVYMYDYLENFNESLQNIGAYTYAQSLNSNATSSDKALAINDISEILLLSTTGLTIGDNIVFTEILINGVESATFGSIIKGQTYYIKTIGTNKITLSLTAAGPEIILSPVAPNGNTYAYFINQTNPLNIEYGNQPYYGKVLDFAENKVIIGTPNFRPTKVDGQVVIYINRTGLPNWSVYRQTNQIVDINRIQNTQLFSAETNQTLINLDYMDPLQGKLLGAIMQNLDIISNNDPASYNSNSNTQSGFVWGSAQVGTIWYDTSNVRYINYHQNSNSYNARYWGTLFPGSNVAVYSWIASDVPPTNYQGRGTPKDFALYTVQTTVNASNQVTPVYYYWVRNTGIVFSGKSLSDATLAEYILNPQRTGISYLAPLAPDAFALYNYQSYVNANDTVLHIGYNISEKDDISHQEYTLIRENYPSDFLPGFPNINKGIDFPQSLYDRMLDSLSGTDEAGGVVPNPFLPKAVQSGILARPRQSFFYNRYVALENYLQYVNSVLALYPITETRRPTFLNKQDTYYNTQDFWQYDNWWAAGFNNNTKSSFQVQNYADLSTLEVETGTIVTVTENSQGSSETYIYDGNNVWTRIGLQNGTIKFKTTLYNYNLGKYGFGGDFYSTTPFDQYPSEETRWIIRAINEQIFTGELLIYRNKGLILLFEYIQSESLENQNYLPWLNKTSLVDVSHTIRELLPLQNFTSDNQEFLSGYVNEAKPYHVVIKEFIFSYKGIDTYQGNLTDFDLPATYSNTIDEFVSPQLVYQNPNSNYEFLPTDPVWSKPEYQEWFNNYGVSFSGQNNFLITKLASFLTIGSTFIVVENAAGFPVTGVIKLVDLSNSNNYEYISYSNVNIALNTLSGLVRGYNETEPFDHIPGQNIYIDLPPVVVLDGGKNYTSTPNVEVYIDVTKFPLPRQEAELQAVVENGKVVSVNVVNPGLGYATLPEIIIDASETYSFTSSGVNINNNTLEVYGPELTTGTLVKYVSLNVPIAGLKTNNWYYVNLIENVPNKIIALYTTYKDCLVDNNRIQFKSTGTGLQELRIGARAIAITSSYPTRENIITLRYDRTSYNSQVIDWQPNLFYGGSFVGSYQNYESVSSSGVSLYSLNPDINSILSSNDGIVFPITNVLNESQTVFSNFERNSLQINNNKIILNYTSDPLDLNPSGSTVGFTVGMPIKFIGDVGSELDQERIYYVEQVVDLDSFTISDSQYGSPLTLTNSSVDMKVYTGTIINTGLVQVLYPGIRIATITNETNNSVFVPLTAIGTGGTQGFYTGMSLIFTGTTFGNIEENVVYYVVSVIDNQTFTISETNNFTTIKALGINSDNQILLPTLDGIKVGDKIIFGDILINGTISNSFGNLNKGTIYYIKEIGIDVIRVSLTLDGPELILTPVDQNSNTYGYFTNQNTTLNLTSAAGFMTMNVQLPISPGQINGQKFTFYKTSKEFVNITPATNNLVSRTITDSFAISNTIVITGDSSILYAGFPFTVDVNVGGLLTNNTYYLYNLETIDPTTISAQIYIKVSALIALTTYKIRTIGTTDFTTVGAIKNVNNAGGFVIGTQYIIDNLGTTSNFQWNIIAGTLGINYQIGDTFVAAIASSGTGNGSAYQSEFQSTGPGLGTGTATVILSNSINATLTQKIVEPVVFDVSYTLGGYKVIISNGGIGYTIDNTFTIDGSLIGGVSQTNDCNITVNQIDIITAGINNFSIPLESNGTITNLLVSGTPIDTTEEYYLKVVNENTFAVYSDPLLRNPVSGLTLPYNGFTITTMNAVTSFTTITLSNSTGFNVDDAIVFTNLSSNLNIVLGQTYYILTKSGNNITISDNPGGAPTIVYLSGTISLTSFPVVTKSGSFAFLPQPFYFNQSIVMYNNKIYECVVSNNDDEFVFGKWEELRSDSYKINAMDRAKGYYQPDINMPGKELQQLFTGVTYPNTNYLGNPFDPSKGFDIDTILQGKMFVPTNVNGVAIIFNGMNYIVPVNLPGYSGFAADIEVTDSWLVGKMADQPLALTDLIKTDRYVMTSTNTATPIFTSVNGQVWTTNGYYVPINTAIEDIPYVKVKMIAANKKYNAVAYGNGKYVAVGSNIVTTSDLSLWTETYVLPAGGELYDVEYVITAFFTGFVAVGKENVSSKVILYSTDGNTWNKVINFNYGGASPLEQNATLYGITFSIDYIVVVGDLNVIYSTDAINSSTDPWTIYPTIDPAPDKPKLNAVLYADNIFITVGDNGYVGKSVDSFNWIKISPRPSTENLNALYYNSARNEWTIVGDNNTVVQTFDIAAIPVVWDKTQLFYTPKEPYNIVGAPFLYGYGPEELVPGLITDQLTMLVKTRAGTTWPATLYANVGYDVVSIELESNVSNVYSFKNVVQIPAQLSVFVISSGLSTSLYETLDYTINWIEKTITLNINIASPDILRIDVYEVGNGDQIVKASTDNNPIITNSISGFDEIYLNCNYFDIVLATTPDILYSDPTMYHNGTKLILGTTNIAIETIQSTNSIMTYDTTNLNVGDRITFGTGIGGGLSAHTTYYIKAKLSGTQFTISATPGGPIINLTNSMGTSIFVTEDFAVGLTNDGIRAKAIFANNYDQTLDYLVYSFFGKTEPIQYGYTIPETQVMTGNGTGVYNLTNNLNSTNAINAIVEVDGLRITPTQYTINHTTKTLTFTALTPSALQIVAVTTFNDTERQYLNTQVSTTTINNQVVPIQYVDNVITPPLATTRATQTTAITGIAAASIISGRGYVIESLGDTDWNAIGYIGTPVVGGSFLSTAVGTGTGTVTEYLITVDNNTNFGSIGQTIQFRGAGFGGIVTNGLVYFVYNYYESGGIYYVTVCDQNENILQVTNAIGNVLTIVGGQITARITTTINHNLITNELVTIDGITGSYQLNNQTFIVQVINDTQFDIYEYVPGATIESSAPITDVNTYISGGYVWESSDYVIYTAVATATTSNTQITVSNASSLIVNTPIYFNQDEIAFGSQTSIPEIIVGTKYFIKSIVGNQITISETYEGLTKTITSGLAGLNIYVSQFEQTNVDRLWVTVNGKRVASSLLKVNPGNKLSILTEILAGDEVVITSMMPSATPDEMIYINCVDSEGQGSVYRANTDTRTWITKNVNEFDFEVEVQDISTLSIKHEQNNVTPIAIDGYYNIALVEVESPIVFVSVKNLTTGNFIDQGYINVKVTATGDYVTIEEGLYINPGDSLNIVYYEADLIYADGEYMRIVGLDPDTKILTVQRGVNNSSSLIYIPKYTPVYSLLDQNKMIESYYYDTWNKIPGYYNVTIGDPLQIAQGYAANFLKVGN